MKYSVYLIRRADRYIKDPELKDKGFQYLSFPTHRAAREWIKNQGTPQHTIVQVRPTLLEVTEWK